MVDLGLELRTRVPKLIREALNALNIKVHVQNILKQNKILKIRIFMQIIWKPLIVRYGVSVQLLEERQTHTLRTAINCREFWMFIG